MSFLIIAVIVIIFVLLLSFYTYYAVFYSPIWKRSTIDTPLQGAQYEAVSEYIFRIAHIMEKAPCEEVTITSFDGCNLHGRYYHYSDGAPLIILFHGYRSCAFRDCSGFHAFSRKMGFNALVIDQRGHGCSGGKTISFGIKERKDCLYWATFAAKRFGTETPIILCGLSMGAATVLMAAELELPSNVACIIADSPFSSPVAIIEKVCNDLHYPIVLLRPFIHLGALLFGRFKLNSCTAKEAVTKSKIPILLIHGEDDLLVPCSMSFEIAKDCASAAVVQTFCGAGHGLSYLINPLGYEKVIYDFLMTIPNVANRIPDSFRRQLFNS